jgi:hypothetical protein
LATTVLDRPTADELAHNRIAAKPVGVVNVLVAGETREDRLAQETRETMTTVPTGASVCDQSRCHVGQADGVVPFAMQQQAAV